MLATVVGEVVQQRLTLDAVLAPHIYVFYAAFIVSFLFTPVMRMIAMHYGIIDQPDLLRKMHAAPVAYLGGVAVFMGWTAGLAFSQLRIGAIDDSTPHLQVKISIIVGAIAIVLLGLWDDVRHIKPSYKISGQVCAALFLLLEGVGSRCLEPVLAPINLRLARSGLPTIPESVIIAASSVMVICVVVGCCNATNLMDGLDGLCGGVTAIIAAGFLFLAVHIATVGADPAMGRRPGSPRAGPARRRCWGSSRTTSTPRAFSWATPAACSWATPAPP